MTTDLTFIVGSVQLLTNHYVTPPANNWDSIDTKMVIPLIMRISSLPSLSLFSSALLETWLADPGIVAVGTVQGDVGGGEGAVPGAELNAVVGQRHHEMFGAGVVGSVENKAGAGAGEGRGDEAEDCDGELHLEGLHVDCGWDGGLTFAELIKKNVEGDSILPIVLTSVLETEKRLKSS